MWPINAVSRRGFLGRVNATGVLTRPTFLPFSVFTGLEPARSGW